MVKAAAFDTPPPGAAVKTVTEAVPRAAMSLAGIEAVSWVAPPNVVGRSAPFQRTSEPETKVVRGAGRGEGGPPAVAEAGLGLFTAGTGLGAMTVKLTALDVPPPGAGVKTVTEGVPAAAMSLAGIEAVSWVAPPNVVGRSAPFQRTSEPE